MPASLEVLSLIHPVILNTEIVICDGCHLFVSDFYLYAFGGPLSRQYISENNAVHNDLTDFCQMQVWRVKNASLRQRPPSADPPSNGASTVAASGGVIGEGAIFHMLLSRFHTPDNC